MRKLLASVTLIGLLVPAAAFAATAEELTAQIQILLQQVQALQQQVGGSSAQVPSGSTVGSSSNQCPLISRNLKVGMSGVDVTRLQQFLALDVSVYPERMVTGYYGALTEAAVKRFQCKNKLVCDGTAETTGYGVTGPRTAALLALQCPGGGGGGTGAGGFIRVTPTSGTSPLNVAIEATVNTTKSCTGGTYEIIYGDNSATSIINVPSNNCNEVRQVFTHTYYAVGTYSIILRSGIHQTSATVTVTGTTGGTSSDIFARSPSSGSAPLTVNFSGTLNSGSCYVGNHTIRFGDGDTRTIATTNCSPSTYSVNHTYEDSGNYEAGFYRGSELIATRSVSVSGSSSSTGGGAFSVTTGTDGDPLKVTAEFDLARSCARYEINWGDGTSATTQAEGSCSGNSVSKTLTHTYADAGAYTMTLRRGSNLNSTDTISLTIVN